MSIRFSVDRSGRALPVREVAARLPLDRLLLETDAPYFVPSMVRSYISFYNLMLTLKKNGFHGSFEDIFSCK